jgi:hypothetical protein
MDFNSFRGLTVSFLKLHVNFRILTVAQDTASPAQVYTPEENEAIRVALEALRNKPSPTEEESFPSEPPSIPLDIASGLVQAATAQQSRPLILYAYSESEAGRRNIEFFLAHALHATADFIFILNGPTLVAPIIPELPNILIVERRNDCYDLGAYAEVLMENGLYKHYHKFIMLNASIRGPFVPYWSEGCWADMFLNRITDKVKVCSLIDLKSGIILLISK